jgi:hypothetical protein
MVAVLTFEVGPGVAWYDLDRGVVTGHASGGADACAHVGILID